MSPTNKNRNQGKNLLQTFRTQATLTNDDKQQQKINEF